MAKKYLKLAGILKRLLFDKDMKAADLARKLDIPAPTIHRLVTGKSTRPYKSSLKPIADFFALSVDQLIGEQPFVVDTETTTNSLLPEQMLHIPLIPWKKLHEHLLPNDTSKYQKIPFIGIISSSGYATILPDYSMEPLFPYRSMLIFDPEKPFKDRSYVLVQLHETDNHIFRQLLIDLDQKYIKPLNPDLNTFNIRALGEKDRIIGTLIEARQLYNENLEN
jgi:transcriptional regulator with XRE-family HTH domain